MTDHPLTNEDCEAISPWYLANFDEYDADRIRRGMRAAYDLGESRGRADMLEQVIEWLEETECNQIFQGRVVFAEDLKKAMRPHEDS